MLVAEAKAALNMAPGPSLPGQVASGPIGVATSAKPSAPGATFPTVLPQGQEAPKTALPNGGKWARYAAKLGTGLTVTVSAAAIRKGGHDPNEPDDADCKLLEDALEEGLRLEYGDKQIPWWLGSLMAAGGIYAGMRIGAPKLRKEAEPFGETEAEASAVPQVVSSASPLQQHPPKPVSVASFNGIFAPPMKAK